MFEFYKNQGKVVTVFWVKGCGEGAFVLLVVKIWSWNMASRD